MERYSIEDVEELRRYYMFKRLGKDGRSYDKLFLILDDKWCELKREEEEKKRIASEKEWVRKRNERREKIKGNVIIGLMVIIPTWVTISLVHFLPPPSYKILVKSLLQLLHQLL